MRSNLSFSTVLLLFVLSSCVKPPLETPSAATQIITATPTVAPPTPTAEPTMILTATPGDTPYLLNGISITIPECMNLTPALTILPAEPYDENAGPKMVYPQHRQVSFSGYPLTGKFFEPIIRVFPVAEYEPMHTSAAASIRRMREVLTVNSIAPKNTLPLLPGYNAAQVFHAQVKFMDFQNGRGLRWLTELAQYSAPVNNYEMFYAYQGMTDDGKYWLSVMLPVNTSYLQETWNSSGPPPGGVAFPAAGSANLAASLKTYFKYVLLMLENTPSAGFTPALDCLDQMTASISISE